MIMHPTIPSIDFNTFLHGSASDHLRIASAIDGALSSVGFIRLHNHGIEQRKKIADMSSTSSETSASVDKSGMFIHIDPNPETLIVNVGYLLMKWSHGRWKNTVHRVSEPPHWREQGLQGSNLAERGGGGVKEIPERYSIAYFGSPDPETIIKSLGEPIDVGEYLLQKRAAMMSA